MNENLQLGKYEVFPFEDKAKTRFEDLIDLLMTDEEREKRYQKVRKEIKKFVRCEKKLNSTGRK